ncbi:MAG: 30S ribosomal protein S19 [Candidatus Bathyarchaeia archaeon]
MPRQFLYRGRTAEELKQMSMDEFVKLLPSKYRRKLVRGLPPEQRKLLEEIRSLKKQGENGKTTPKTHCRDMVILPEMIGTSIGVHDGKEFVTVTITPKMIGHLLGEFALTSKKVVHGNPGIGASRSSMYVPLK